MSKREAVREWITDVVSSWPGVEAGPGPRGEFAFKVDGHEIGHLHGDQVAHFHFPKEVGEAPRKLGRVQPHPVAPQSYKLAARRIVAEADVLDVIELMRRNYERIVRTYGVDTAT